MRKAIPAALIVLGLVVLAFGAMRWSDARDCFQATRTGASVSARCESMTSWLGVAAAGVLVAGVGIALLARRANVEIPGPGMGRS